MTKLQKIIAFVHLFLFVFIASGGCARITAQNLDPSAHEAEGIPFYLPKPYLIVAKNVRYIPAPTVGLTRPAPVPDSFDANAKELTMTAAITQSRAENFERKLNEENKFQRQENLTQSQTATRSTTNSTTTTDANTNANTKTETTNTTSTTNTTKTDPGTSSGAQGAKETQAGGETGDEGVAVANAQGQVLGPTNVAAIPSSPVNDGLVPETFYTYQIVYLPDLTQKYGLKVNGGPGEFRATMNLVNGWMYTGMGPTYMRDSTTAAQTVAAGTAISDVIDSLAGLSFAKAGPLVGHTPAMSALIPGLNEALATGNRQVQAGGDEKEASIQKIQNHAEIYIYEPTLVITKTPRLFGSDIKKEIKWKLITTSSGEPDGPRVPIQFDRDFVELKNNGSTPKTAVASDPVAIQDKAQLLLRHLRGTDAKVTKVEKQENTWVISVSVPLTPDETENIISSLKNQSKDKNFKIILSN